MRKLLSGAPLVALAMPAIAHTTTAGPTSCTANHKGDEASNSCKANQPEGSRGRSPVLPSCRSVWASNHLDIDEPAHELSRGLTSRAKWLFCRCLQQSPGGVHMSLFDLKGRVALVTGGNGGIGLGMARGLAGAGAAVAVAGRNKAKSEAAAAELAKIGRASCRERVEMS